MQSAERTCPNNVTHDIARQGSRGLSNVNGCCKIVAEFERCQCPQLSCPLHYPKTAMGLGVPDDHALDQNSSRDLDGLVCGQASGFEKEMRGMLVEKTSPGLRTLVRLLQKSEGFVFFSYVGDAGNTSSVDAGTPLGATAVVTPGSAGYLLWECCILASLSCGMATSGTCLPQLRL